ncbi:PilN domain-containing protein [Clostridium baratii]|uniref:PilN domain-containing protein n=1 Tax=Clostridium baratii TaxID=1561 RepID=UPI0005F2F668|nr:PilN domain-containing protein [Clostridium baratii]KJU70984.1 hypothetical protein UC77_12000 [Clostridium baratii]
MNRELNLLPREYVNGDKEAKKKNIVMTSIIGLCLIVGISFGFVRAREMYLKVQNNKLKEELQSSKEQVLEKERLELQIELTKKHIEVAKSLKSIKDKDTYGLIKLLMDEANSKNGISLEVDYKNTGFSKNQSIINIDGTAKNIDDINRFWASLRESELFNNSHLNGYSEDKGKGYNFSGTITIGGTDLNVKNE